MKKLLYSERVTSRAPAITDMPDYAILYT